MARKSAMTSEDVARIKPVVDALQYLVTRATTARYINLETLDEDITCFTNGLVELEQVILSVRWSGRRKHAGEISKILVSSALSNFGDARKKMSATHPTSSLVDVSKYVVRYCASECSDALREIRYAISME